MTRTSFKKMASGRTKYEGNGWVERVNTDRVANKRTRKEGKKICKDF